MAFSGRGNGLLSPICHSNPPLVQWTKLHEDISIFFSNYRLHRRTNGQTDNYYKIYCFISPWQSGVFEANLYHTFTVQEC